MYLLTTILIALSAQALPTNPGGHFVWLCQARGKTIYFTHRTVNGSINYDLKKAKQSALKKCRNAGLRSCVIRRCNRVKHY